MNNDGVHGYSGRDGFLWNYDNNAFILENNPDNDEERGYVRCVKDTD